MTPDLSKMGDQFKDKFDKKIDQFKDPEYLKNKAKETAKDVAGDKVSDKTKEAVQDVKKTVELAQNTARAVESAGADIMADLEILKQLLDKEYWKRMGKRAIKAQLTALVGLLFITILILTPLILPVVALTMASVSIAGHRSSSCPLKGIPTDVLARYTLYEDYYQQASDTNYTNAAGEAVKISVPKELLAAVDYKETNIAELNVCDPASPDYATCLQANGDAVKCRAIQIGIDLQKSNADKINSTRADVESIIDYLGNFRVMYAAETTPPLTSTSGYEPYEDDYITQYLEDRSGWGLPWLDNLWNRFRALIDDRVGAATFFRLTAYPLNPDCGGAPPPAGSTPPSGSTPPGSTSPVTTPSPAPVGGILSPSNANSISRADYIDLLKNDSKLGKQAYKLAPYAGQIYDACQRFNINPLFVTAMYQLEAGFGRFGAAAKNNNPGNVGRRSDLYKQSGIKALNVQQRFAKFKTMGDGAQGQIWLLRSKYFDKGLNTIETIMYKYAPPSENDTEGYIRNIKKLINKYGNM